ncbi:MAG TPA: BTAD domain-containing putative transcriptional regulator [Steroidobacteraceae bacterium]|nr:BTAD domain-containing putative transcriptional regulator [Steroidobacteraceae bacterium]
MSSNVMAEAKLHRPQFSDAQSLPGRMALESSRSPIRHPRAPPPPIASCGSPWAVKIYVLGRFRVFKGDAPLQFSRRIQRRTLDLLQALIALGGTEVSAGALIDALWPDSEGDAGYHALESALYRLRQLLDARHAVTMAGGKVSLERSHFWVDMWEFEKELQSAARLGCNGGACVARLRQLYQGHFLQQECDKPWALQTRQVVRDKFARAIRVAAQTYESRRRWQEAADVYLTGIELDGLAEDLYRGLMVCYRALGNHTEALQVYRRYRELLVGVLGVQPNAKTQAIYQTIKQDLVAEPAEREDCR